MPASHFQHSEAFLQWIWQNLLFDFTDLKTECGKNLHIISPGLLNTTDGPDFTQAAIEMDGLRWHGDIEIHVSAKNWNHHGHHVDENFDNVILHVVADDSAKPVYCNNESSPFTLNLLPYLSDELHVFLKGFEATESLPCASGLNYISPKAFQQQIEKAHREYFEKKANDFLRFYNPELVISKAWKHALIISLWDGLGISHNRTAMREVITELLQNMPDTLNGILQNAYDISGFGSTSSNIKWNMKAVRPANHPQLRIKQAASLTHQIHNQSFKDFIGTDSLTFWKSWLKHCALKNTAHFKILYGTVFLPSLYVLGNLLAHTNLSDAAFSEWASLKSPIPASLLSKFEHLNLNDKSYRKKLGSVHQLKSYCSTGKCSECFVLKKVIQS